MHRPIPTQTGLLGLLIAGILPSAMVHAQSQPPAPKNAANTTQAPPTAKAASAAARRMPNVEQVVAVVNGDKINVGDLLNFLQRYPIPPLPHEQIYRDAVETLINTRLIGQFLARQHIDVPPERVNEAIAQLERDLRADGQELRTALIESGQSMDELRREYLDRIRWVEFLSRKATDDELKRFAASHKDLVSGTRVRASHIYLAVPDEATPAEKEKIRQKLLSIKRDILDKKMTFAEAADKFSEDPANIKDPANTNSAKRGGDIGEFGLGNGVVDEFATAAFALKPGEISEPVESPHGLHLIMVTDRKEGGPVDFEKQKPFILQLYAANLQKQILTAERKDAEARHAIEIKPMPPDLFPPSGENPPAAAPPG